MKRKSPVMTLLMVVALLVMVATQIQAHNQQTPPIPFSIAYFTADPTVIPAGGCTTLSYWVIGARRITLWGSNWPGGPQVITDNPNQRIVCPSAAAGYIPGTPVTYTLRVIYLNGRTEKRSVTINVLPAGTPVSTPVATVVATSPAP